MEHFELFIIGHLSRDVLNVLGDEYVTYGGAALYAAWATRTMQFNIGVWVKTSVEDKIFTELFPVNGPNLYWSPSKKTTSIRNVYDNPNMERRKCYAIDIGDPFLPSEMPEVSADVYYLGGLIAGEFDLEFLKYCAKKGKVAMDVQGFVRHNIDGILDFQPWKEKEEGCKYIHYFKADAAEVQELTGETDRVKGASIIASWGAKEVMVSHHTELLTYIDGKVYKAPLKPQTLRGRTGRGDTSFSTYVALRNSGMAPQKAIAYTAALVSLKIAIPGPFKMRKSDVEAFFNKEYAEYK
jgi:sugar/nucleoside kinase (ribokinase family)